MKTRKEIILSLISGIQQAEANKSFNRELYEIMCELFESLDYFDSPGALLKFIRDAQAAIIAEESYQEIFKSCIGIVQDELMTRHRKTVFEIVRKTFVAKNEINHEIITHFIGSELLAHIIEKEVFK